MPLKEVTMKRCKNYINGAWTESVSGNAAPTFNPATGEELAQVVVSTRRTWTGGGRGPYLIL